MLGTLIFSFAIVFTYYLLVLHYASRVGYLALYIALGLTMVAFFLLNGGFSQNDPTKESLRDDWDDEKKERFIKRVSANRRIAKRLIYILIPLIITCGIDIIYLTFSLK